MKAVAKEIIEARNLTQEKANHVAKFLLGGKNCLAFTGAGISTSAGIPDYRSDKNTVLQTGAGSWM